MSYFFVLFPFYYIFDAELYVGVSTIMNIWIIRSEFWSSVAIMALK